jgi:uncharacterized protein YidB (DUF937 family)
VFVFRFLKWVYRLLTGRAIPGLSGQSLSSVATSLLGKEGSQLPGLIKKLTTGGLGDLVQSWISKGKNLPLSAHQVKSVLDSKTISGLAAQLGISEDAVSSKIAGALPQLINKLTPDGRVPDQETLARRLAELLK